MARIWPSICRASAIRRGASNRALTSSASRMASMRPRATPAATARASRAETWAVKALVEATPISGPAWVGHRTSASRAMDEVWTLTTAAVFNPCALHQVRLARVSAVSPDWLTATATVPGVRAGER
ncbi:hypothetical protein D3C72_1426460 [compost metagenome]